MITIYLTTLHSDEDTTEVGDDEPYVLVTSVDLALKQVGGFPVPVPAFEVVKYGPFDLSKGETQQTHSTPFSPASLSFWGVGTGARSTGDPATLTDPDLAIFIVALMENDDGDPEALRGIVKGEVGGSVLGSLSSDRANKVTKLINDVNSALGTPTGGPNFDDKIGGPQELRFSREELARAEAEQIVSKTLVFEGDGGRFTLTFEAVNPAFMRSLRLNLQRQGFDLRNGISIRSINPPVKSLRAFMQV